MEGGSIERWAVRNRDYALSRTLAGVRRRISRRARRRHAAAGHEGATCEECREWATTSVSRDLIWDRILCG